MNKLSNNEIKFINFCNDVKVKNIISLENKN